MFEGLGVWSFVFCFFWLTGSSDLKMFKDSVASDLEFLGHKI